MTTFLDRYLRGEYQQVWDELYAQGEAIHQGPRLEDAAAVAKETMLRVRTNIQRITARLYSLGYAFGTYPDGQTKIDGYTQPHHLPKRSIEKAIAESEGDVEAGQFGIPVAPDYFHKDNVSGGAPYTILVPNAAVDAVFAYERHQTTFVNYLRICFSHGGFPGIDWHNGGIPKIMAQLSDELFPI